MWWATTLSSIIGTVVGIVITFGVGYWAELRDREKDRKLATMMIAGNVIEHINSLCHTFDLAVENAPYVERMIKMTVKEAEALPEDSLAYYLNAFRQGGTNYNDFARNLLNTNLDILRSTDNYRYLFFVESCYNYFDNLEDFINASGPKSLAAKINEIINENNIKKGVFEQSMRSDLIFVADSPEIKGYILEYLNLFISRAEMYSKILKEDTYPKLLEYGGFSIEELKEYYPVTELV